MEIDQKIIGTFEKMWQVENMISDIKIKNEKRVEEQCCETAPQFFIAYGELWLSFLWPTAESLNSAKKP